MAAAYTTRKMLTDVVAGVAKFSDDFGINYNYAKAACGAASDTAEEPIGIPLIWNNTNTRWERYLAQDIAAVTGSPLPGAVPICISVGTKEGKGFNEADVTLGTSTQDLTVIYRGPAGIKTDGIDFGAAIAGDITEFKAQMEVQGLAVVTTATTVTPTWVG